MIFIHIPKAAGNSVTNTLFGVKSTGHFKAMDFLLKNPFKYKKYFKFTISRNPYERFVSAFEYLKSGGMSESDRTFEKKYLSEFNDIDEFCTALKNNSKFRARIMLWTHFIPQERFVRTYFFERDIKFYKLEDINNSILDISERLNIRVGELQHDNKTKDKSSDITDNVISMVNLMYKNDFKVFNYGML